MTPEHVAQMIVSTWQPPSASQLGPDAERRLAVYWQELGTVFAIKAWRSVMSLSGQLIEALVKHRLLDVGYRPAEVDRKTLGQLLAIAVNAGVLPRNEPSAAPNAILSAALILRNWASHYSAWARDPDAYQSAQALTLLVASSESVYPTTGPLPADPQMPRRYDDLFSSWDKVGPAILISALEKLPPEASPPCILLESPTLIADHFVRFGAASTIVRLEAYLRSRSLPIEPLHSSIINYLFM